MHVPSNEVSSRHIRFTYKEKKKKESLLITHRFLVPYNILLRVIVNVTIVCIVGDKLPLVVVMTPIIFVNIVVWSSSNQHVMNTTVCKRRCISSIIDITEDEQWNNPNMVHVLLKII